MLRAAKYRDRKCQGCARLGTACHYLAAKRIELTAATPVMPNSCLLPDTQCAIAVSGLKIGLVRSTRSGMKQWPLQFDVSERSGSAEVSAEFLLRLVPMRASEDGSRFIELARDHEGEEVELEIEVAPCGEVVSLLFLGNCYET
jgi:hypothetical protein